MTDRDETFEDWWKYMKSEFYSASSKATAKCAWNHQWDKYEAEIAELRQARDELLEALKPISAFVSDGASLSDLDKLNASLVYKRHAQPYYRPEAVERLRLLHKAQETAGLVPEDAVCIASNDDGFASYYSTAPNLDSDGDYDVGAPDKYWAVGEPTLLDRSGLLAFLWLSEIE